MKLPNNLLLLLWFVCPVIALADEYRLGNFEFHIPGSWQVKTTKTEVLATHGDRKPIPNTLLKMELCVPTEAQPCKASMFFPPANANPENYYCGETKPTTTLHSSGLKEIRKVCSIKSPGDDSTQIGMLYLTSSQSSLVFILLSSESSSVPAEFLDAFISSLVVK